MRASLIALLAFAAGILTMLWVQGWLPHTSAPHALRLRPAAPATAMPPSDDAEAPALPSDDWPEQAPTPEQVLYTQPRLLRAALDKLAPRVPGKPNLYLLAFAADGSEDVFHNEAEYAARLFTRRFGPTAHALVLENHPDTLATRPLATWSNLESALDGLAQRMDPQRDILLLYMTTHGSEDHTLLVDMDPLPLDQIGAQDLGAILAAYPFKWKVVVVNACYSGGFIPSLQSSGTLVLTAARSDRSSFGCGNDSAATYFGHAWLVDALNRTPDFIAAFGQAKDEIAGWERQDRLLPSEPQMAVGKGIAEQLARWRQGVVPGPAVPFLPASPQRVPVAAAQRP
ncbi:C13 family peptidase [Frateuria terrea]|uniref:Peptidase C13 family protein n=1 Tax=Frateuria terrea TaxID=529704 RepID=A0A1H6TVW1_9GAMM|nr:C13 family peptidase [Frateuria terrea]SEI84198.1 Peptidase C13 family protein [Frateuria terrea]SFP39930.1 Peptidase C13 family protein [Frateuria terrea]